MLVAIRTSLKRPNNFPRTLEEPLPFAGTLAWANIGLGEIAMKRGQRLKLLRLMMPWRVVIILRRWRRVPCDSRGSGSQ